jgi:hypothetical protein
MKSISLLLALTLLSGCITPIIAVGSAISSTTNYIQLEEIKDRIDNLDKKDDK